MVACTCCYAAVQPTAENGPAPTGRYNTYPVGDPTPRCRYLHPVGTCSHISDPIIFSNNRCNINMYNISGINIDNKNDNSDPINIDNYIDMNISGSNIYNNKVTPIIRIVLAL